MLSFAALPNAILFAVIGLLVFAAVVSLLFRGLLGDLWLRATQQSEIAAAIVVAAFILSLALIVSAAVH